MSRRAGSAAVLTGLLMWQGATLAAQATITPPPMLSVTCETVKQGMGLAHDRNEERWARAVERTKGFPSSLAVQSATGPAMTCWLTSTQGYETMAKAAETMMADAGYTAALPGLMQSDAPFVSDVRNFVATLRPDLSAGEMPNVLSRRSMMWSEWQVRPGPGEALFAAAVKAYVGAMERAGVKPEFRVYQVRQGAPGATYWMFVSASSMARFDADVASEPRVMSAMSADDNKVFDEYFSKAHVRVIENLWNYVSAQSALTAEQRASDPFWRLKSSVAARP